ncbi:hypothetical protein Goarm_022272, partial [Gossypium armourianum]|nr:hypothetical protein [Gossypium armourianum]
MINFMCGYWNHSIAHELLSSN